MIIIYFGLCVIVFLFVLVFLFLTWAFSDLKDNNNSHPASSRPHHYSDEDAIRYYYYNEDFHSRDDDELLEDEDDSYRSVNDSYNGIYERIGYVQDEEDLRILSEEDPELFRELCEEEGLV